MSKKNKEWIKASLVRAIRTMAQTMTAMISTSLVLTDVNWKYTCSATVLAGLLSILTSIGGLPEVKE